MGMVFALGWTPCIGPVLGSVLTYTASSTSDPVQGAVYLAAYGLGFSLPLLVLSLFADGAKRFVGRMSAWLPRLQKVGGLLMMAVGLYLMLGVTTAPSASLSVSPAATRGVTLSPALGQPSSRPRMVQFTSSDCSVCRQMIPTVALIERDCDGRKVDVIKVDVTHKENHKLASNYGVRGVPTFVFLDTSGDEVARLVGYQKLGSLRQALSALVGEPCDGLGLFVPETDTCENGSGARCSS
jgi:cytochrome c-type biogenesis protein